MTKTKEILFPKHSFLAIIGDDGDFWLARVSKNVFKGSRKFNINWLEKVECAKGSQDLYELDVDTVNSVEMKSVIVQVNLKLTKNHNQFGLNSSQKKKIETALDKIEEQVDEEEEEEEETVAEINVTSNRKRKSPKANNETIKKAKLARTNKGKGKNVVASTAKGVKLKKPPNWRLKQNDKVPVWEEDPFFESKEPVPFISSTVQSKLAIRAVLMKDYNLLKSIIQDKEKVHSLQVKRSLWQNMTPLQYAVKKGDVKAMKMLTAKGLEKYQRADAPHCMMEVTGTGVYNYRSLNIRRIRKLNMSRGGREGNNALTKDVNDLYGDEGNLARQMMEWDVGVSICNEALALKKVQMYELLDATVHAIRCGYGETPSHFIAKDVLQNKVMSSFNRYHHEALVRGNAIWKDPIREVSAKKKGPYGLTPLHCAAINFNTSALKQLFAVCPDVNIADEDQRKLVHYAAASFSTEPLKFLVGNGANLEDVDKVGMTPLMIACMAGRPDNVRYIIETIKAKKQDVVLDEKILAKIGTAGINRPNKNSWCPLHYAVLKGHLDVVKILVKYGVDVEKPLNATFEKKTPLMLAAEKGDLKMVRYLTDLCKIEKADRYKRTALTHAAMNGAANIVSLLLHMGANPDKPDTSGNTNLHYACAYGWLFCAKALISAGATINQSNEWKLTPVAIAFLRGHSGIAKYLLDMPGVDIDFRDDQGRTVLMRMIAEANKLRPLTETIVKEIKYMVKERGADPKLCDHNGKNVLHYLASYDFRPNYEHDMTQAQYVKKYNASKGVVEDLIEFFIKNGTSTLASDKNGHMPVMYSMELFTDEMTKKKDYDMITTIINDMEKRVECLDAPMVIKANQASLLSAFCANVSFAYIETEKKIFERLCNILTRLDKRNHLSPNLTAFVEAMPENKEHTPLMLLCLSYKNCPKLEKQNIDERLLAVHHHHHLTWNKDGNLVDEEKKWEVFRNLMTSFVEVFSPKTCYKIKVEKQGNQGKTVTYKSISALLILAYVKNEPTQTRGKAFQAMLKYEKEVDATDDNGQTALNRVVRSNGQVEEAERLIEAGADVNFSYLNEADKFETESGEIITAKSCPLYDAVCSGRSEMVCLLLQHKADIFLKSCIVLDANGRDHGKCLFTAACDASMRSRQSKEKLSIVKKLITAGANVNAKDKTTKRNALHLAINNSSDKADQALDLEIALLRNGCDVFAKDFRGRLPLHYAFVKIGSHKNCKRIDPIEVCSMLVEAMKGVDLDLADEFGSTPLHYAAYRGAIVSSLLLLQRGAEINRYDSIGNSPLAYSALGKHEGCALTLLQKEGDVNVTVHEFLTDQDHKQQEKIKRFFFAAERFSSGEAVKASSLFECVIQNDWLGMTYMVLQQLEKFGMSYAKAIETAFYMQKLQFAKTLIGKQVALEKLQEKASKGRNLIASLAYECNSKISPSLQEDILELLLQAKVPVFEQDYEGSNALHYACKNHNITMIKWLLKSEGCQAHLETINKFGISPLAALFWKFDKYSDIVPCLKELLAAGCNPNVLFHPLTYCYLQRGTIAQLRSDADFKKSREHQITPLIAAIIHGQKELVSILFTSETTSVDLKDGRGLSPLMHAVKTNDLAMVVQVMRRSSSILTEDQIKFCLKNIKICDHIDKESRDDQGRTIFHHLICFDLDEDKQYTFDNAELFEILCKAGMVLATKEQEEEELYHLAKDVGAKRILEKLVPIIGVGQAMDVDDEIDDTPIVEDKVRWSKPFNFNVLEDAQKMLQTLEKKASEQNGPKNRKCTKGRVMNQTPSDSENSDDEESDEDEDEDGDEEEDEDEDDDDSDDENSDFGEEKNELNKKPKGCIVNQGHLYNDYSILMTKIDVTYGPWGMYNFYRMQIWKEKHKDLWILFTNWGRIGDAYGGQYQNTPYGTPEQAVEEFEKIFKAKSGNDWANRANFENKAKKYRMVKVEHLNHVKKSALKFDLDSKIPSELPEDIQDVIKDLANVSMHLQAYKELGADTESVPFGRIKKDSVMAAKEILEKLKELIADKEHVEEKNSKNTTNALQSRLFEVYEEISKASADYYHLMPKKGFSYTRLRPIDSINAWNQEMDRVNYTLEFETAERLILAAQYRKDEMNPLDYIYQAIGCTLEPLEPKDKDVTLILQYINNSDDGKTKNVEGIYRIRANNEAKFGSSIKKGPLCRKLLWHGSKAANLISIFNKGLQVSAPYAPVTGKSFGNGLYTADVFDKSFNYTFDWRSSKYPGSNYMLLCDVALGKSRQLYDYNHCYSDSSTYPGKGFDSVQVHGQAIPDPRHTLKTRNGLEIPLGNIIPHPEKWTKKNFSPFVCHSEYVTFDSSQTALRYLIKIQNHKR